MAYRQFLRGIPVFILSAALILACENGTTGGSNTPSPPDLAPALRAVPTASSTSTPVVLDSFKDGTKNYYLIDVGYIRNIYISTVADTSYNGMTPMNLSKTTITENTVTEAMTETISESVTVSNTQTHKAGIQTAWESKFPKFGKFSVKLNYTWTGSWTNSTTSTKLKETSLSAINTYVESSTTSFTVGEHGEPKGHYRYALYAVCDVYFVVSTSLDNQQLISWDTVACVREGSYIHHFDFSENGNFDNSPQDNEITFAEEFYKSLPLPSQSGSPPYETDWKLIRAEAKKITDSGRFNQTFDTVNFNVFTGVESRPIDLNVMKQEGYKTISFKIRLNVKEVNDGYQHLLLFTSPAKSNDYFVADLRFEHSRGKKDTNWWVHYESELKFDDIPIDIFTNEFVIRYTAGGNYEDSWENKDLYVQLIFKK